MINLLAWLQKYEKKFGETVSFSVFPWHNGFFLIKMCNFVVEKKH